MKRKIISYIAIMVLTLGLMPVTVSKAYRPPVSYINADGTGAAVNDYRFAESSPPRWEEGWYVVDGNVEYSDRLYIEGDVNVILCDGASLTAQGIIIDSWYTLTIYCQRGGTGQIQATAINMAGGSCGIRVKPNASLVINGGEITATGTVDGSGIGGSNADDPELHGNITINGGTVTATASNRGGAGIGGASSQSAGNITINGGTVTATGGSYAEGIGKGEYNESSGNLTLGTNTRLTGSTDGSTWTTITTTNRTQYMKVETLATVSTAPTSSSGLYATGASHALLSNGGTATNGRMKYALGSSLTTAPTDGWSTTIPTGTAAQTYYVWYKAEGTYGAIDSSAQCISVTINPVATVSTLPTIRTGLLANGTAQDLLATRGAATNGTMKFALGTNTTTVPTSDWGTDIPQGTAAQDYYVWYKAVGTGGACDSAAQCLTVTISDMPAATVSTLPTASTGLTANGFDQALLTSGGAATNGTMQYAIGSDGTNAPDTGWGNTIPTGNAAQTYYVWYKAAGDNINYTDSAPQCITVAISAASAQPPVNPPVGGGDTTTYTPPAPEPNIGGKSGWSEIVKNLSAVPEGGTEVINMNGTITLPTSAINAMQGKDANFVFDMGNGIKWTINGKDINTASGDVYLGVYMGTTGIPVDFINNLTGEREKMNLMLSRDGGLGFTATLTLPLKKEWSGLTANLFNYNKGTKEMDFVSSGQINAEGSADLIIGGETTTTQSAFKKAGLLKTASAGQASAYYTIVIDDHSLDPNIKPEKPDPVTPTEKTYNLKLKGSSKKSKVTLSWKKLKKAKKYRIYQKVGKTYKLVKELKKNKLTIKKSLTKTKKKEAFKTGKNYTFKVTAYIEKSWKKKVINNTVSVKVK